MGREKWAAEHVVVVVAVVNMREIDTTHGIIVVNGNATHLARLLV